MPAHIRKSTAAWEAAPFLEQVAVAVAQEAARAITQRKDRVLFVVLGGHLQFADRRLVIAETHVFGPVFGRNLNRHAGGRGEVEHLAVDALGMHVDFDRASGARDAVEDHAPEIVAALGDAAFAMNPHRDSADARACLEDHGESIPAIGRMCLGCESFDVVLPARGLSVHSYA